MPFNNNWDGIQRNKQPINEATSEEKAKQAAIDARVRKMNTDDAVEQVKEILRSYGNDKKQREMIIAAIKNIKEETSAAAAQRLDESRPLNEEYIELEDVARNIRIMSDTVKNKSLYPSDISSYLKQLAGSLQIAHRQQQDFYDGVIYHLDGVRKKLMSPSRHGNMEILKELEEIIRELKKYKK